MQAHPRALDYAASDLDGTISDEAELTAGVTVEAGNSYGFFTDTTRCIGCKACEVACKEWNLLPADGLQLTGMSYDNTGGLSARPGVTSPLSSTSAAATGAPPQWRRTRATG